MSTFKLNLTDDASFRSAFERNHAEAVANHESTTDVFLKALWARQIIFWGRMVRFMSDEGED